MKDLRITVTDDAHEKLDEVKGDRTWREALFEEFGVDGVEA